jgi:hypothetical protein
MDLVLLVRHLADCPPLVRTDPRALEGAELDVGAVVSDVLHDLGLADAFTRDLGPLLSPPEDNHLRLLLVAAYLLHHPLFRGRGLGPKAAAFLGALRPLAGLAPSDTFTEDPERREELVRRALAALGLLPDGESPEVAAARLSAVDSVERARVVAASRIAEQRARAVREALQKKAAEEAAAKVSRE